MYPADEGVYLACVSGRMGTGIWASGLGGRFRERAWRPGYGDIGMGMEYGDIGMGIGTQPYLSVSGCTSSEKGFLPVIKRPGPPPKRAVRPQRRRQRERPSKKKTKRGDAGGARGARNQN